MLGLADVEDLIRRNVRQPLPDAAWPLDLHLIHTIQMAQSEVHAELCGGSIADRGGHVVMLLADRDFGSDAIPVALGTRKANNEPRVVSGAGVLEDFG